MSVMRARSSSGTRFAASPIISSNRTSARLNCRSLSRSERFRPRAISTASRAWSSMWRRHTFASRSDVLHLGFCQRPVAEMTAQELWRVQVNFTPQDPAKLSLHAEEFQTRSVTWLELHQNIHVTPCCKVTAGPNQTRRASECGVFGRIQRSFPWKSGPYFWQPSVQASFALGASPSLPVSVILSYRARQKQKGSVANATEPFDLIPATTDSPTRFPLQYHGHWRA